MKILLVDDEQLQLIRLENTVKKVLPDAEILSFTNPKKAYEDTIDMKLNIAFLDIEMPLINGIYLAKKLKKNNPLINVIFVTAYDKYALDAYNIHASGYVVKPVKVEKVKKELDALRYEVELKPTKLLQVKCFGSFEVFKDGKPLKFHRQKSKELFAYLVDREGSSANINELNAVLWEEDHKSYLRNLIADIQQTLKAINCEEVFNKTHNGCSINIDKVDCDAYEYKNGNPDAIRMYRGEYMAQYPWAVFEE